MESSLENEIKQNEGGVEVKLTAGDQQRDGERGGEKEGERRGEREGERAGVREVEGVGEREGGRDGEREMEREGGRGGERGDKVVKRDTEPPPTNNRHSNTRHSAHHTSDHTPSLSLCLGCHSRLKCPLINSRTFLSLMNSDPYTCCYHLRLAARLCERDLTCLTERVGHSPSSPSSLSEVSNDHTHCHTPYSSSESSDCPEEITPTSVTHCSHGTTHFSLVATTNTHQSHQSQGATLERSQSQGTTVRQSQRAALLHPSQGATLLHQLQGATLERHQSQGTTVHHSKGATLCHSLGAQSLLSAVVSHCQPPHTPTTITTDTGAERRPLTHTRRYYNDTVELAWKNMCIAH